MCKGLNNIGQVVHSRDTVPLMMRNELTCDGSVLGSNNPNTIPDPTGSDVLDSM